MALVYVADKENYADIKVYKTDKESHADLSACIVNRENHAKGDELWFFEDREKSFNGFNLLG